MRVLIGTPHLLLTRSALTFTTSDDVTHDVVVGPEGALTERLLIRSAGVWEV